MTDHAEFARDLLGLPVAALVPVAGGDICRAFRATAADGTAYFVKVLDAAPDGFFAAEAAGLRWLASGGARVPEVVGVGSGGLALRWHDAAPPGPEAAARLGRDLAALHAAGADAFGARPPGAGASWTGRLPTPTGTFATAAEQLAQRLRDAARRASLAAADADAIIAVCDRLPSLLGPAEPPARLHGDLWSGNLLWRRGSGPMLVDPAAHGGHRETDLAMLQLFGAPYLSEILSAYQDVSPLAPGWEGRVGLHQLHPLLVHAALFGGSYGARAAAVAREYL
ncbi:MAG TPA: fructosamine kinase family protein [Mycobacteriales bacterium]|nr:fructosamine kinase family protein [Mycobacteriales bacterium]